jgi:apolipoprotein N-acyltransferase
MPLRAALALTTISGVVYGLAFPPLGCWPLAWVALAPFLVALGGSTARRAVGLGLWLGIVASYAVGTWMPDAVVNYYQQPIALGGLVFLACALWQAAWQYAAFALITRRLVARGGVALPLLAGAAWVAAEVARTAIPFGNPWAALGYSQTAAPLLVQIADFSGIAGVSFVVAAVNAALAGWWVARGQRPTMRTAARRGVGVAAFLFLATVGYGAFRLSGAGDASGRVAMPVVAAQANLDLGTQWQSEFYGANLDAYAKITMGATVSRPARLVVWPESALTFFLEREPTYQAYLSALVAETHTTLLTGGPRVLAGEGGKQLFRNAAFLVAPSEDARLVYEKETLVPFAEYFPFASAPLLRRQFGEVREFTPGSLQVPFATPIGEAGMMICNEAMLGAEAVERVRGGAEWLVTLTNDSWVGRRQYAEIALAMVRLRAVEVRRWLVRSSTSGPSAMIDPEGRIVDALPFGAHGVVRADLVPRRDLTLYARSGDAFAWICVLVTTLVALASTRR